MVHDLRRERMERELGAAYLVHEAKLKEHTAACLMFDDAVIESARLNCLAALEALLDRTRSVVQLPSRHEP